MLSRGGAGQPEPYLLSNIGLSASVPTSFVRSARSFECAVWTPYPKEEMAMMFWYGNGMGGWGRSRHPERGER